jgi:hypothetical protein
MFRNLDFAAMSVKLAFDSRRNQYPVNGAMMTRLLAIVMLVAACKSTPPVRECVPYPPALMPRFTDGLIRKDFRLANAWAVKSDKPMETLAGYFVSADIIAPNGEAVIGTWLTDNIMTAGKIYSVSPQATKYSNWGGVGDKATAGVTMETGGAAESRACVQNHRGQAAPAPAPAPTTP